MRVRISSEASVTVRILRLRFVHDIEEPAARRRIAAVAAVLFYKSWDISLSASSLSRTLSMYYLCREKPCESE